MPASDPHLRQRLRPPALGESAQIDKLQALLLDVEAPPAAIANKVDIRESRGGVLSGKDVRLLMRAVVKGDAQKVKSLIDSDRFKRSFLMLIIIDLVLVSVHLQLSGMFGGEEVLWLLSEVASFCVLLGNVLELVTRLVGDMGIQVLSGHSASRSQIMASLSKNFWRRPWLYLELFFIMNCVVLELSAFHKAKVGARILVRVFRSFALIHALAVAVEIERAEAQKFRAMQAQLLEASAQNRSLLTELYYERSTRAKLEAELSRLNGWVFKSFDYSTFTVYR